jgi:hypothetical protein
MEQKEGESEAGTGFICRPVASRRERKTNDARCRISPRSANEGHWAADWWKLELLLMPGSSHRLQPIPSHPLHPPAVPSCFRRVDGRQPVANPPVCERARARRSIETAERPSRSHGARSRGRWRRARRPGSALLACQLSAAMDGGQIRVVAWVGSRAMVAWDGRWGRRKGGLQRPASDAGMDRTRGMDGRARHDEGIDRGAWTTIFRTVAEALGNFRPTGPSSAFDRHTFRLRAAAAPSTLAPARPRPVPPAHHPSPPRSPARRKTPLLPPPARRPTPSPACRPRVVGTSAMAAKGRPAGRGGGRRRGGRMVGGVDRAAGSISHRRTEHGHWPRLPPCAPPGMLSPTNTHVPGAAASDPPSSTRRRVVRGCFAVGWRRRRRRRSRQGRGEVAPQTPPGRPSARSGRAEGGTWSSCALSLRQPDRVSRWSACAPLGAPAVSRSRRAVIRSSDRGPPNVVDADWRATRLAPRARDRPRRLGGDWLARADTGRCGRPRRLLAPAGGGPWRRSSSSSRRSRPPAVRAPASWPSCRRAEGRRKHSHMHPRASAGYSRNVANGWPRPRPSRRRGGGAEGGCGRRVS